MVASEYSLSQPRSFTWLTSWRSDVENGVPETSHTLDAFTWQSEPSFDADDPSAPPASKCDSSTTRRRNLTFARCAFERPRSRERPTMCGVVMMTSASRSPLRQRSLFSRVA